MECNKTGSPDTEHRTRVKKGSCSSESTGHQTNNDSSNKPPSDARQVPESQQRQCQDTKPVCTKSQTTPSQAEGLIAPSNNEMQHNHRPNSRQYSKKTKRHRYPDRGAPTQDCSQHNTQVRNKSEEAQCQTGAAASDQRKRPPNSMKSNPSKLDDYPRRDTEAQARGATSTRSKTEESRSELMEQQDMSKKEENHPSQRPRHTPQYNKPKQNRYSGRSGQVQRNNPVDSKDPFPDSEATGQLGIKVKYPYQPGKDVDLPDGECREKAPTCTQHETTQLKATEQAARGSDRYPQQRPRSSTKYSNKLKKKPYFDFKFKGEHDYENKEAEDTLIHSKAMKQSSKTEGTDSAPSNPTSDRSEEPETCSFEGKARPEEEVLKCQGENVVKSTHTDSKAKTTGATSTKGKCNLGDDVHIQDERKAGSRKNVNKKGTQGHTTKQPPNTEERYDKAKKRNPRKEGKRAGYETNDSVPDERDHNQQKRSQGHGKEANGAVKNSTQCKANAGVDPHAHLRQAFFPHLKKHDFHKHPYVVEHKVLLIQPHDDPVTDMESYLFKELRMHHACYGMKITAVTRLDANTTYEIAFPNGKIARKFRSIITAETRYQTSMGTEKNPKDMILSKVTERMTAIEKDCINVRATHATKKQDNAKKLKNLKKKKVGRFHLDELLEEKDILKQKKKELDSQEQEFNSFMKVFKQQFQKIVHKPHWKDEAVMFEERYECEKERMQAALPMYANRTEIINTVAQNQVSVLLGETGSGKSTQVAQYLYEAGLAGQKKIVCTQPRKVAATSLAKRVSTEMHCQLGGTVGFKVGMLGKMSKQTRILYMTDHILLKELLDDPLLTKYSCVIIDEAHERSLSTDLLLAMIKKALPKRPDLRVIITSATIDPAVFQKYFDDCPVLKVSGRVFPVEVFYENSPCDPDSNYVEQAVNKAVDVASTPGHGDILVFLTTPLETEQACEMMMKLMRKSKDRVLCLALHGKTESSDQQKVFSPTPCKKRKIVFATNSAETSVTIPGIRFVIDTGLVKEQFYDHTKNMSNLKVTTTSKSSANQRKGRAGRTERGKCYRLYTKENYEDMVPFSKPDILKVHLGMALLDVLSFGVADPLSFDFVETPPREGLEQAMDMLLHLEAVDKEGKLTPLGKKLALMSLEPQTAKLVLKGIDEDIGFESVLVASFGAMRGSMFFRGTSESSKQQANKHKVQFCNPRGDIHSMLDVYKEWKQQPEKQKNKWCMENSINAKCMRMVRDSAKEIQHTLSVDLGIKLKQNFRQDEDHMQAALERVILEIYAMNLCVFSGHELLGYTSVADSTKVVQVHPSSVLKPLGKTPHFMVYGGTVTTLQTFAFYVTCISDNTFDDFVKCGKMPITRDEADQMTVSPFILQDLGAATLKMICFPTQNSRLKLETELKEHLGTERLVVEADVKQGKLSIFTLPESKDDCQDIVRKKILEAQEHFLKEEYEGLYNDTRSLRVILGNGGQTKHLLFPGDIRTLHIPSVPSEQIDDLLDELREIANIRDYKTYDATEGSKRLKVVFEHPDGAAEVLARLEDEDENAGTLLALIVGKPDVTSPNGLHKAHTHNFSVKITWRRRFLQGYAFVQFDDTDAAKMVAEEVKEVSIGREKCPVSISTQNEEELYICDIPPEESRDFVFEAIREQIEWETEYSPRDIVIPVEKPMETSYIEVAAYKAHIEAFVEVEIPDAMQVDVRMLTPNDKTVNFVAYVNLQCRRGTHLLLQRFQQILRMPPRNSFTASDTPSRVPPRNRFTNTPSMVPPRNRFTDIPVEITLQSALLVHRGIYPHIEKDLLSTLQDLGEISGFSYSQDEFPTGPMACRIRLCAQTAHDLSTAREKLSLWTHGTRMQLAKAQHLQYFQNTSKGQLFLKGIQKQHHILVTFDRNHAALILHGCESDVNQAKEEIDEIVNQLTKSEVRIFNLKQKFPVGMAKHLMKKYGLNLQDLAKDTALEMVDLELRKHLLTIYGSLESVKNVEQLLNQHARAISDRVYDKKADKLPDCPICFVEVDADDTYRLESCGHAYCGSCSKALLEHGARDKTFPIQCAKDGCGKDIVISDIRALVGKDSLGPFLKASVHSYVTHHGEEVKYCITPSCDTLYRTNDYRDNEEAVVVCDSCKVKICTRCHLEDHHSLICDQNKRIKEGGAALDDYSKETWLKEDHKNRALCPKCQNGIEKNGGCRHVFCIRCRTHICWVCKETFQDTSATYDHLRDRHNGIFGRM